jgi:thermitase
MYPGDQYGHGSMVYDVIHTLAPQSNIVSIKVLDASGNGRISSVMEGLQLAVLSNSNVVNMSLGTPVGTFDSLSQACRLTSQIYGIKIFAASGNVGEQGTLSPAISSEVVSVGAVDSNLQVDYYSSRGKVDTSAFGDINAMWLNSPSNISGTSCASPQVAALYTDWLSGHPTVDAGRIDQFAVMKSASVSLGQSTSATGWGLLAGQALAQTEPTYSPTLIERLELPIILLSIVLIIIALIAVAGRRR